MRQHITFITLGVDDLGKSVDFYQNGLGFTTKGIIGQEFENGAVAFFDMQPGLKLALWPKTSIARETGVAITSNSSTEVIVSHNVASKSEVDEITSAARNAGAKITKEPHDTFYGGYAAYFQDLDDHIWEIVFNPGFENL